MKKFLLALGVLAVGFSAQAYDLPSTATYAIINIPVVGAKQNLIGASVSPLENGKIADLLGVSTAIKAFDETAGQYVPAAADDDVSEGDILLVDNESTDKTYYEVGSSTASGTVTVNIGSIVVLAAPQGFDVVANTDLAANSGSATVRSKCTTVSIWDAANEVWVKYWYKGGSNGGWRRYTGGTSVDSIPVGAGQPFVVQKSNTYDGSTFSVTL